MKSNIFVGRNPLDCLFANLQMFGIPWWWNPNFCCWLCCFNPLQVPSIPWISQFQWVCSKMKTTRAEEKFCFRKFDITSNIKDPFELGGPTMTCQGFCWTDDDRWKDQTDLLLSLTTSSYYILIHFTVSVKNWFLMLPADGQPGCDITLEKNLWAGLDNNVINLVQSQADERCQIEIFGMLKLLGKNFIAVLSANPHQPVECRFGTQLGCTQFHHGQLLELRSLCQLDGWP